MIEEEEAKERSRNQPLIVRVRALCIQQTSAFIEDFIQNYSHNLLTKSVSNSLTRIWY